MISRGVLTLYCKKGQLQGADIPLEQGGCFLYVWDGNEGVCGSGDAGSRMNAAASLPLVWI